jgi:UDP-N-acetylglucosamine 2-epimerase (non-hydrolysing)
MRGKTGDWTTPFGDGKAAVHVLDAIPELTAGEAVKPTE